MFQDTVIMRQLVSHVHVSRKECAQGGLPHTQTHAVRSELQDPSPYLQQQPLCQTHCNVSSIATDHQIPLFQRWRLKLLQNKQTKNTKIRNSFLKIIKPLSSNNIRSNQLELHVIDRLIKWSSDAAPEWRCWGEGTDTAGPGKEFRKFKPQGYHSWKTQPHVSSKDSWFHHPRTGSPQYSPLRTIYGSNIWPPVSSPLSLAPCL